MSIAILAATPGAQEIEASLRKAGVPIDTMTGARANLEKYRAARASLMYHALSQRGADALMGGTVAKPDGLMSTEQAVAVAREALNAIETLIPK